MHNIMKQLLPYAAGVFAFSSAVWSFTEGHTWPGILAILAGILAIASVIWKDDAE